MPLRAIALHNSVSQARLRVLFGAGANDVFAGANKTACAHCQTPFVLWFADSRDPEIPQHARTLEVRIAEDCADGTHPNREIQLNITP